MEIATLGAGCFWCIEAILLNVAGVTSVDVGYTGGKILNPTYKMVCEGNTGHAEVAQIEFDSTKISYEKLLNIFLKFTIQQQLIGKVMILEHSIGLLFFTTLMNN